MMHVWYSNQLERLADRLIENLGTANCSPANTLVHDADDHRPNRNIETYLKYEIARGAGIAAGLNFKVPEEFLKSLLAREDGEQTRKLVSRNALRAFFIEVLSQESDSGQPLPDAVRAYIDAGGDDQDARDLRRFQLGSRLAQLARQYGDYRPDWLRAWAKGQITLDGDPLAGTERWQRDLWARLIEHRSRSGRARHGLDLALRAIWFARTNGIRSRPTRCISLVSPMSGMGSPNSSNISSKGQDVSYLQPGPLRRIPGRPPRSRSGIQEWPAVCSTGQRRF